MINLRSIYAIKSFIFLVTIPTIATVMLKFINYHLTFPRQIRTKPLIFKFKSPSATRTFLIQPVYPGWALQCDWKCLDLDPKAHSYELFMQSFPDFHLFHSQRKTFYCLSERQVCNDCRHLQKHQLYLLGHGHQLIKNFTFFRVSKGI